MVLGRIAPEYSIVSNAGIFDDITSGVKNFVINNFDTAHPIRGIFKEFLAPGVIWGINPMLGVAYELAGVLGFVDWNSFWDSVIDGLESLVSGFKSSGTKPTEDDLNQKVGDIIEASASRSFQDNSGDKPTDAQMQTVQKAYSTLAKAAENNSDIALLTRSMRQYIITKQSSTITKTAGWASSIFRSLFKFLLPKLRWIAVKALVGLGMTAAAGAASTIIGTNEGSENEKAGFVSRPEITNLIPMSKSAPQDLFEYHGNDMHSSWVEDGNISDAPIKIMEWVLSAYPQLKKYVSDIEGSSVFNQVISRIVSRNRLSADTGFYVIPPPFHSEIEIVSYIVSDFVSEHLKSLS